MSQVPTKPEELASLQRRWIHEPRALAGLPLAPNGDWSTGPGGCRVRWNDLDWEVTAPNDGIVPTNSVLPVYLSLVGLLRPGAEGDTVRFSPNRLLCEIDRGSRCRRRHTVGAGGSAYEGLVRVLRFLRDAEYSGNGLNLSILSAYRMPEKPGRLAHVQFSPAFMELMGENMSFSAMNLRTMLELPRGASRALYRLLSHLRGSGIQPTVGAPELLQRLGSLQDRASRSAVRQRVAHAHEVLQGLGVLDGDPEWDRERRRWRIRYTLAPRRLAWLWLDRPSPGAAIREWAEQARVDDTMALVAAQAITFGVSHKAATELARERPERFTRATAAAAIGLTVPVKTLAAMIVDYTRKGHPISDVGRRIWRPGWPMAAPGAAASRYVMDCWRRRQSHTSEKKRLMTDGYPVSRAALDIALSADPGGEPWVLEGITALIQNIQVGVPPIMATEFAA